ncbi:MAG TPA: alpha-(1-_3)-arabinofuranosyltransferase family protein [Acidimicrobiales bacterium]|nr:alpha-(1->3)-arabinofuranosyltransferase family protein [Acidimicrobiales bacterium]
MSNEGTAELDAIAEQHEAAADDDIPGGHRSDSHGQTADADRLSRVPGAIASLISLAALAAVAYVPLLLTKPGTVAADTKAYLYLDPGRLLRSAAEIWNPSAAGGEVTFQNIGYLFPQGPWYWLLAHLGAPIWVAQRLWVGTLLFGAGAGVRYLARVLGLGFARSRTSSGAGRSDARLSLELAPFVAGLAYMLSPYFLQYVQRISVIVAPWSGLGWMLGFTVMALRRGGWRYPALFAIVVALVGGTNATSLLYVGLGPVLYLPYAVLVTREASALRAVAVAAKIGALSLLASLWWIAALAISGAYGIDVLKFTETVPAVASTSLPSEVMRGLGYWFFYGGDRLGTWVGASVDYETTVWLLITSFAVPALAMLAAVLARWRHRAYFAFLALVGLVLSVGTYPYFTPSFLGRGLRAFMTETTAGFALRSTDRATPLVILSLSMLLGSGTSALIRRARFAGIPVAALAAALVLVNGTPFLQGAAVETKFSRPEHLPSYVQAAARYLDAGGSSTRVLFEPGEDFGAYNWGDTIDSIWPGLMMRPTIQREQLIRGGIPTADLVNSFDLTLQQGTFEPTALAPVARILDAGQVVLQSNLAYWWYNTPKPVETWQLFADPPPPGLSQPVAFGPPVGDDAPAGYTNVDEQTLALTPSAAEPPSLAVFGVSDPRPIYRAEPAADPVVIDGDGAGLVAAAASGLLADSPTIFYSGSLIGALSLRGDVVSPGSQLVLTDSNAKAYERWTTVQDNIGEVLPAYSTPAPADPTSVPLVMFPRGDSSAYTTAAYSGAVYVTASGYGNPISFTPEDRPYEAFDGNTDTAWTVAAFSLAESNWIEVKLPHAVTAGQVNLVQPLGGDPDRWITQVKLTFDGGDTLTRDLGPSSRTVAGQSVSFPNRSFTTLRITIERTNLTGEKTGGLSGVGFAEIRIPGVTIGESLAMPTDMLQALGSSSLSHRLTIITTRQRVAPVPPRSDPETSMSRILWLPTERTFTLSGTARISALIPDNEIDDLLGGPHVLGGVVVGSDARLPGDLQARALYAFDGNPATAWMPGFGSGHQIGAWMEIEVPKPISFDHLDLQLLADGRHSVPTAIRITTDLGSDALVHIPPVADRASPGATASVQVTFPSVKGSLIRFTIEGYRDVTTTDYYSTFPITMPVGIAELGVPGLRLVPENPASPLPDICRHGLVSIDGRPFDVRVVGTVGEAEQGQGVTFVGCGNSASGVTLGPGTHTITTTWGKTTGYDIDRLVLDSAPGGGAQPLAPDGSLVPAPGTIGPASIATPKVEVERQGATSATLEVSGASGPFWLVMGQSLNSGWTARIPGVADLGKPVLIDGFANGWYVTPPRGSSSFTVALDFGPQKTVDDGIGASALALAGCLLVALWPRRLRLRRRLAALLRPRPGLHSASGRSVATEEPVREGAGDDLRGGLPDRPRLGLPLVGGGRRIGVVRLVLLAAAYGGVGAAIVPPPWGPRTGVVAFVAVLLVGTISFARPIVSLAACGFAVASGLRTALDQVHQHIPGGASWPSHFGDATTLAWFAFIALAVDGAVESMRWRRHRPAAAPSSPSSPPEEELEVPGGDLPDAGAGDDGASPPGVVPGTGVDDLDVVP